MIIATMYNMCSLIFRLENINLLSIWTPYQSNITTDIVLTMHFCYSIANKVSHKTIKVWLPNWNSYISSTQREAFNNPPMMS